MADGLQLEQVTTPGDLAATDDIGGQHYQRVKANYGDDGSATDVSLRFPMPAEAVPSSPKNGTATAVALSPGSSTDLDSPQITASTTGKLSYLIVSGNAPLKVELKTVVNAVETTSAVFTVADGNGLRWRNPARDYVTAAQTGPGFDGFRCTVTNNDTGSNPTDVYASYYYDEVI